ncbi:class I SAM-dependent methyltransferase [Filomicrobium sp.]|uniref:class I SAM-dependent methyltransferase n=1 Tax=Filomicrobium sp. TaxID=2024831 RepID=UPI00258A6594|nr:class I SAM-dependent methyltransferase [Filomicrobium sp.]MCV0368539.1 class I SAM-dependent methyltransferase [Filomicrobium sp.]
MSNRYRTLAAWVYHVDKPIGHSFGDIEFYRERLAGCEGPILEPAVGNGRAIIPLIESGCDVVGFDTSADMLDFCRKECAARGLKPSLSVQSFESFEYDRKFEAIIIPAGSFQLITEATVARSVLCRFQRALSPGGRLIVDLDPISSFVTPGARVRHWQVGDDVLTLQESRAETDFVRQTTVSQLRYEHWRSGQLVSVELDLFSLRWWGIVEFELALREAGFTEIVISGDYRHGLMPKSDVRSITFEARIPE